MQSIVFVFFCLDPDGEEVCLYRIEAMPAVPFPLMIYRRNTRLFRVTEIVWNADSSVWNVAVVPADQNSRLPVDQHCQEGWTVRTDIPY